MIDPAGITYIRVYSRDGGSVLCVPEDEGPLDAALTAWIESAKTRDTLLYLTALDGDRYVVLASDVTSWVQSTPAGRARATEIDAALRAENNPWESGE